MSLADLSGKIPNNVDIKSDRRLQRALESWQPKFIDWWKEMYDVFLYWTNLKLMFGL